MGQAPSSRVHCSPVPAYTPLNDVSDDANGYGSAIAKQRESLLLDEQQALLRKQYWAVMNQGPSEIRYTVEEYTVVTRQWEAAKAAKEDDRILRKLNNKRQALGKELNYFIKGKPKYEGPLQAVRDVGKKLAAIKQGSHCSTYKPQRGITESVMPLWHRIVPLLFIALPLTLWRKLYW